MVTNPSSLTQVAKTGTDLGEAHAVTVVDPVEDVEPQAALSERVESAEHDGNSTCDLLERGVVGVCTVVTDNMERRRKLLSLLHEPESLDPAHRQCLLDFLADHHQVFSLGEFDRGETDLVEMEISTGDARPKR